MPQSPRYSIRKILHFQSRAGRIVRVCDVIPTNCAISYHNRQTVLYAVSSLTGSLRYSLSSAKNSLFYTLSSQTSGLRYTVPSHCQTVCTIRHSYSVMQPAYVACYHNRQPDCFIHYHGRQIFCAWRRIPCSRLVHPENRYRCP